MRKRTWVAASLLALGMLATTPGSALAEPDKPGESEPLASSGGDLPGTDGPPAGFESWSELMEVQRRLDARAERILAERDGSFTGIEIAAEQRRLTVFWKGQPPPEAVAAMKEAGPDGDVVEMRPAQYSQDELVAEGEQVARQDGVTAVAPQVDGSGLLVSFASAGANTVRSSIPITSDVAVPAAASRGDDQPPYWGGARWNACSTGFAISLGGSPKMLSAGHCGSDGQTARDGGGQTMGTIAGDSNPRDQLYIDTSSAGRIYNGGVGTGEFSNPVVGAARSFVGDFVCTSGAYSGTRCGSRVTAVNQTINFGYLVFETVRADKIDGTAAIGNGDSGGPVFSLPADTGMVIARGTNTAIDLSTEQPCTGVPTMAGGRRCASRFWYVDVTRSLSVYGATIITG